MEYLIGSVITFLMIAYLANKVRSQSETKIKAIRYDQMRAYENVKNFLPSSLYQKPRLAETQMSKHNKQSEVRVLFIDNKAYWIANNSFYSADLEDGIVNQSTTKVVDIMSMDKVELDKMTFIVEMLTEDL